MPALPAIIDTVSPGQLVLARRYRGGNPSERFEPARVLGSDFGTLSESLDGVDTVGARIQVCWLFDDVRETVDWHFGWVRELTNRWVDEAYTKAQKDQFVIFQRLTALSTLFKTVP